MHFSDVFDILLNIFYMDNKLLKNQNISKIKQSYLLPLMFIVIFCVKQTNWNQHAGIRMILTLLTYYLQKNTTVKPVLSGHSKIDKTKVLKTNGSLMKVKSIYCRMLLLEHSAIHFTCIER